jgi:hypothetical protein
MKPNILFTSTLETESNRVIHAAVQTANGFYHRKKFAVLPYLVDNNPGTVFLPEIAYHKIPNLWKNLSTITSCVPLNYDKELVSKFAEILESEYIDLSEKVQEIQIEWTQKEDQIFNFLEAFFPTEMHQITQIEVRISAFGTKMSYETVSSTIKAPFICYIRQDMGISNIIEAIIQGLLFAHPQTKDYPWEAHEAIADFLLDSAKNQRIITSYSPTLNGIHSIDPDLLEKSHRYLQKLGLNFDNALKKEGQLIYLNNKIISAQLTAIQHIVLSLLIDKQNQVVTYDQLADILWHDDEEFSVWAINKNMQRLRTKLTNLGASEDTIRVVKGSGYSLQN